VTVDLQKPYATVQLFDPMIGTEAVATWHDVSTIEVDLTDIRCWS
jgi:hypothetical protein